MQKCNGMVVYITGNGHIMLQDSEGNGFFFFLPSVDTEQDKLRLMLKANLEERESLAGYLGRKVGQ